MWDGLKWGDEEKEVKKVVVSMFNTVSVIRRPMAMGADMVIVHEPTFYANADTVEDNLVYLKKKELVDESGMVFCRTHDHPHFIDPDLIHKGMVEMLQLDADVEFSQEGHCVRYTLRQPMTAMEVAEILSERLHTRKLHVAGSRHTPLTHVSLMSGSPGHHNIFAELKREETELMIVGEITEWCHAEYARDATDLGMTKALIPLGHVGSEWGGMELICRMMKEKLPEIEFIYVEDLDPFTDEAYEA